MWKRRSAESQSAEDQEDLVIDLRERLEPYGGVDPEALKTWRRLHAPAPAPVEPPKRTAADWLS